MTFLWLEMIRYIVEMCNTCAPIWFLFLFQEFAERERAKEDVTKERKSESGTKYIGQDSYVFFLIQKES